MPADAFAVLAEPHRRTILDELLRGPASVGELVAKLEGVSQPTVSKHLKVLLDARFVLRRTSAQQRIYALNLAPLEELDAWLRPYRMMWERSFDALSRHLDQTSTTQTHQRSADD